MGFELYLVLSSQPFSVDLKKNVGGSFQEIRSADHSHLITHQHIHHK